MNRTMMLTVMAVATAAGVVNADVTYLTQARSVSVTGNGLISASAVDFSPFNETVSNPEIELMIPGNMATQDSSLLSDRMSVAGSVTVSDGTQGQGYGGGSLFDVTFSIDQATNFHFFGSWILGNRDLSSLPAIFPENSFFRLSGPGTSLESVIPFDPISEPDFEDVFDFAGVLQPGEYRLEANLDWRGATGLYARDVRGDFNVTLLVPVSSSALAFLPAVGLVARRRRR